MSESVADYEFDLPPDSIAQFPLEPRDSSRLFWLHRQSQEFTDHIFSDVPDFLIDGDLLIVNNTRVSARRLKGRKRSGGKIELLLLRSTDSTRAFECLAKPAKSLRPGTQLEFDDGVQAQVVESGADGHRIVQFEEVDNLKEWIQSTGEMPLPPYVHRRLENPDLYQTVYAADDGSAAAPTAGLHFTPALLSRIRQRGVSIAEITLDVGIDTFRPVSAAVPEEHAMHGERYTISESVVRKVSAAKGRIIAVGTTTVRALESAAIGPRKLKAETAVSKLFIRPGFEFKIIDGMFTNFHMPRTTMLMMISALAGTETVLRAYRRAVLEGYRFLSFGDAMLIL